MNHKVHKAPITAASGPRNKYTESFVSVILPVHNIEEQFSLFLPKLHSFLSKNYKHFEIIIIDDCSTDNTRTVSKKLLKQYSSCHYICLSRKFGIEISITAGLNTAIGDICLIMVPGYDPIEAIPNMVNLVSSTGKILVGQASEVKYPYLYRAFRNLFYIISRKIFKINLISNCTHFMAMNRKTLNSINSIKDKFRYIKVFTSFPSESIQLFKYKPEKLTPHISRSKLELLGLGMDLITTNSIIPLRLVSALCCIASLINLTYVLYIFTVYSLKNTAEGWVTLSMQQAGTFFILSLAIMTLNEYVGRIFVEGRNRPFYFINSESRSDIDILNKGELKNVVSSSTIQRPYEEAEL